MLKGATILQAKRQDNYRVKTAGGFLHRASFWFWKFSESESLLQDSHQEGDKMIMTVKTPGS